MALTEINSYQKLKQNLVNFNIILEAAKDDEITNIAAAIYHSNLTICNLDQQEKLKKYGEIFLNAADFIIIHDHFKSCFNDEHQSIRFKKLALNSLDNLLITSITNSSKDELILLINLIKQDSENYPSIDYTKIPDKSNCTAFQEMLTDLTTIVSANDLKGSFSHPEMGEYLDKFCILHIKLQDGFNNVEINQTLDHW